MMIATYPAMKEMKPFTPLAVDDANAVAAGHYTAKLRQLEHKLNQLNFLEHPIQIQQIAQEMKSIYARLKQLEPKNINGSGPHTN
jgi:TolA-binding protein